MDFKQFHRTTGSGGAKLAEEAWEAAKEQAKAALSSATSRAAIDKAFEFDESLEPQKEEAEGSAPEGETVQKFATDSGRATEKGQ